MTMGAKFYYYLLSFVLMFRTSIFAKADPLGNQAARDIPSSAFDAAIREFQNRNGNFSESEEEEA
jgi:hypothetical protein